MAVMYTSDEGCILDHDQAIAASSRQCIYPLSIPLPSHFLRKVNKKEGKLPSTIAPGYQIPEDLCQHPAEKSAKNQLTLNLDTVLCDHSPLPEVLVHVSHSGNQEKSSQLTFSGSEAECGLCDITTLESHHSQNTSSSCVVHVRANASERLENSLLEAECTYHEPVQGTEGCRQLTGNDAASHLALSSESENANDVSASMRSAGQKNKSSVRCYISQFDTANGDSGRTAEKTAATIASKRMEHCNGSPFSSGNLHIMNGQLPKTTLHQRECRVRRLAKGTCSSYPSSTMSLRLKQGFFSVNLPFMMDSQFEKVNRHLSEENSHSKECEGIISISEIHNIVSQKRKRKKADEKIPSSEEGHLLSVHTSLACAGRKEGLFLQHIPLPLDNNLLSRQCAQLDHSSDTFTDLLVSAEGWPILHYGKWERPLVITSGDTTKFTASELIHRRVSHEGEESTIVNIDETPYVLPPSSVFLLSNLQDFCEHLHLELDEGSYDLIVLDPPWENKSVKRKKSYNMISEEELKGIPMARLTRPGCLVALWVTNNSRLEEFSLHSLFPLWGLTAVARWHWMKVTRTGDLISSLEDGHKKPYEILLLAKAGSVDTDNAEECRGTAVPESKVFMSVPCSLHSKKPHLGEILQPYLPSKPKCLELFARNLWPHWTSWGREALKHQNLLFYELAEDPD